VSFIRPLFCANTKETPFLLAAYCYSWNCWSTFFY